MIASIFSKSKPINIVIISVFIAVVFTLFAFVGTDQNIGLFTIAARLFALLFTLFLLDFIISKNNLTKKNSYAIMFFGLLLALFPEVLLDSDYLWSNVFVVLAIRRLISLHSRSHLNRKLFDAAFWLSLATLLNPWAVLFFGLIVVALLYYSGNDLKTIIIPVVGVLCVMVLKVSYNILVYDVFFLESDLDYPNSWEIQNDMNPKNLLRDIVVTVFLFWSLIKVLLSLKEKKTEIKPAYILLFWACLLGLVVAFMSVKKGGAEAIYFLLPAACVIALNVESINKSWVVHSTVTVFVLLPIVGLFL